MYEIVYTLWRNNKKYFLLLFIILFVANCVFGILIFSSFQSSLSEIYFLNVGQGDAELITLDSGAVMLVDAGPPNGMVLDSLSRVFPVGNRSIDLLFVSHPESDHMGGIQSLLDTYRIGAVVYSGREGVSDLWKRTKKMIEEKNIQIISVGKGDRIKTGDSIINILSPDFSLLNRKETNESSLVLELIERDTRSLFVGDSGKVAEANIIRATNETIDVLKVGHHGSKYSSLDLFLGAIKPNIAVIEVGKNSYGHPTQEVLSRLSNTGASIFRTDQDGTVTIELLGEGKINIYKEK